MPSIQSQQFRRLLLLQRVLGMTSLSIVRQREEFELSAALTPLPDGLEVCRFSIAAYTAEWLRFPDSNTNRVLFYLHGGAYIMGSTGTHRGLVARIAKASGIPALQIDYRLAPEHPFPAALEDVLAAYDWLLSQGYAPQQIILGGDSAGGGLALALMLSLREQGKSLPQAAVLISPWIDMVGEGESIYSRRDLDPYLTVDLVRLVPLYCGSHNPRNPLISPVFADLHGLPPLFVQVGDHEILLSDSTRLMERGQAAGVQVELQVWPYMWHVWHLFAPWLPEAMQAIMDIGSFIRQVCAEQYIAA